VFVQVIQGQVTDAAEVRAAMEQWVRDLAPGAMGWLGSTTGVTEDGRLVALARFESIEAAQRNGARPEQDAWWAQTSKLFTTEPTFTESEDVVPDLVGDPDTARFVQVMQGRVSDQPRARELMTQGSDVWAEFRPEVLGSLLLMHGGGEYTMALYFTTEADAREGERKQPPPELAAQMREMESLTVVQPSFYDLRDPWMHSPGR